MIIAFVGLIPVCRFVLSETVVCALEFVLYDVIISVQFLSSLVLMYTCVSPLIFGHANLFLSLRVMFSRSIKYSPTFRYCENARWYLALHVVEQEYGLGKMQGAEDLVESILFGPR